MASPPNAGDQSGPAPEVLRFEDRTLDLAGRAFLDADGREVQLTRAEFTLLATFVRRPGRVLSRDELRHAVAGRTSEPYDRSIDMLVARLRRKIEPDPKAPRFILTVPGEGYKFAARPQRAEPTTAATIEAPQPARAHVLRLAERRQLTVLACQILGFAALSAKLDPEDLSSAIGGIHDACARVVARFRGLMVRIPLADGLLVYFGYPEAREDDAERAVRAALELVRLMPNLELRLPVILHGRIGIATGLMVIGDRDGPGSAEPYSAGEALNLALCLRSTAAPDSVVIAAATRDLIGRFFNYHELEPVVLPDGIEPVPAWHVVGENAASGRFEALRRAGMPQLVDRREEFELLWRRWGQARNGSGQVVLLTGEAGIGKSRLATELVERTRSESHAGLYYFGLPHQTDASLFALIGELQKAAGFEGGDTSAARRAKLEVLLAQSGSCPTDAMTLLADVLSLPSDGRCGVAQLTPHQRKERTFAALMARIEGMAARQPVLAVVEDIQWVDPTSLEFLALLVEKVPRLPVLMLIAARPEFRPPWPGYAHVTMIALPRLGRDDAEALVGHAAGGKSLPEAVTTQILARTDGLPLFLEELTKTVLESGLLQERAGQYELRGPNPTPNIPKSLHGSLLERLDRLGPARDVAQIAAVIGREFPYELLRMVVATPESGLGAALDRIVASELVFGRGVPPLATYVFKHALVRETAYGMLPRVRRRQLHGAIARALEERFPDVVETQPELLGHHHAEAGGVSRAVAYLVTAGERSLLRSAITEALAHLTKALALLSAQPQDDARRRQELTVQVALSRAWVAKMGHTAPETFRALDRARELCELLGDQAHLPVVIYGQWQAAWGAGAHVAALGHAQAMLKWGERVNDPAGKTFGHFLLGVSSMLMGALSTARRHLETALALDCFESSPFGDLVTWRAGVIRPSGRFALCDCLFLLGWPAQAETVAGRAMIETDNISHNYARALALSRVCRMHALRRDARSLSATAAELLELSSEEGYPHFAANSMLFRGWALTLIGETVQGLELARSGIARCRAIGFLVWQSQLLAMLAECHAKSGDLESGLRALAEAMEVAEEKGERFYEPELHRLRGELYRDAGRDRREVEDCFVRALDAARRHEARLLELRAATSLARLMASQGRQDDARDALAPIYNWFTEGLDTDDLQSAKVVLDSLR